MSYFKRFVTFSTTVEELSKSIQKIKTVHMQSFGLQSSSALCLVVLSHHEAGLSVSTLAKECKLDKAAVSRTLHELYRCGAVCYPEAAPDGKRNYRLPWKLTPKGKRIVLKMRTLAERSVKRVTEDISPEELAAFYHTLGILRRNLTAYVKELDMAVKRKEC